MVTPSYFLACRIFLNAGLQKGLRAVPEDEEGIDIDYLEAGLKESEHNSPTDRSPTIIPGREWNKLYRNIIYAVPTFSNPSGKTMSLNRRKQLVKVARQYDALIITDDVFDVLQWETNKNGNMPFPKIALLPRLVDIDREMKIDEKSDGFGNAASNGSFSKIVGPGCRTGWAGGTEKFAYGLSQLGSSKSGGAPSQLSATFIAQMLQSGTL